MVAINPALEPAQAHQGPRGRALPDHGSPFWRAYQAVARSPLSRSTRLVAFEVVHYASLGAPGHARLTASVATLAERCGLSPRTVRRCVGRLVQAAVLVPDTKGDRHGRQAGSPVRYLVRLEALTLAPWAEELTGGVGHHGLPGSATMAYKHEEHPEQENTLNASPLTSPKGAHATEGTEGRGLPPSKAARESGKRAAAEGLRTDASPFHSACAALVGVGVDALIVERLVQALGPEQASDVAGKVKRKRNVRNGGALVVQIVKADHPEAWTRFQASKPRGGTRADRKRRRDPFDLETLDLGHGFAPSQPAAAGRLRDLGHACPVGHEPGCGCEAWFAVLTAGTESA